MYSISLAASQLAKDMDQSFMIITGICLVLLVGITLAMIGIAFKFRRSANPTTVQIRSHLGLEIVWIIVPTALVMLMFWIGYRDYLALHTFPEKAMIIEVTGEKWFWTFRYPEQGLRFVASATTDPNTDVDQPAIPVGEPVIFRISAPDEDVIHSFFVPDFRVKHDAVPGKITKLWLEASRPNTHLVLCAEYCGTGHSQMWTRLHAKTRADFERWVEAQKVRANVPFVLTEALDPKSKQIVATDASRLYAGMCASCHGQGGEGGGASNARNFRSTEGWKQGHDLAGIYRTLRKGLPGTQMRAFPHLNAWETFALSHHVQSFRPNPPPPPAASAPEILELVKEFSLDQAAETTREIPLEEAMRLRMLQVGGEQTPPGR